jgi:hypothetical protein
MPDLIAVVRRYWPVVVAAVLLVPHALMFDFVNDDAYISFRYARNLAEHGQLVFNLGERVEGFTNFLWTVLLAGGIKLGLSPVLTSRFFGIAFGVGTMAVAVRLSLRLDRDKPSRWHLVAPLGLAATGPSPAGARAGLETADVHLPGVHGLRAGDARGGRGARVAERHLVRAGRP